MDLLGKSYFVTAIPHKNTYINGEFIQQNTNMSDFDFISGRLSEPDNYVNLVIGFAEIPL